MAKANDKSSTIDWIWLHDALMLAISRLGSVVLAKALLTEWLAAGKLPWSCMAWKPRDLEGIAGLEARAWDLGVFPNNIPPPCREGEPEIWRFDHTIGWEDNMASQYWDFGASALGIKVSRGHLLALLPEEPRERVEELGQTKPPAEPELLEPKATPTPESHQWKRAERYIKKHYPDGTDGVPPSVIHRKLKKDKDLQAELEKEGGPWDVPSPATINRVLGRRKK
jgi:hypothetical protein